MTRRSKIGRPPHPDMLTPAEWRVIEGVRHGLSNPAIAARLEVSSDAVKFHVSNALNKLGLTGRAELKKWDGVRKDSAMAQICFEEGNIGALGPIGQIARSSPDVARAAAWFADTLGVAHQYTLGDLAFFDCGGVRLMISKGDSAGNSILYFLVHDIIREHQRLVDIGVDIVAAPHRIHVHTDGIEEWMCFFRDIDGSTLALMSSIQPRGETK